MTHTIQDTRNQDIQSFISGLPSYPESFFKGRYIHSMFDWRRFVRGESVCGNGFVTASLEVLASEPLEVVEGFVKLYAYACRQHRCIPFMIDVFGDPPRRFRLKSFLYSSIARARFGALLQRLFSINMKYEHTGRGDSDEVSKDVANRLVGRDRQCVDGSVFPQD